MRRAVLEQHWGCMDQFAGRMVAHGPTCTDDETLTGSVHIVDLPDVIAARAGAGRAEAVTAPSGKRDGIPPRNDVCGYSAWWGGCGRAGARCASPEVRCKDIR